MFGRSALLALTLVSLGCDRGSTVPVPASETTAHASAPSQATSAAPAQAASIDPEAVAKATGGKAATSDGVVKVSFPRDDVAVEVDGWTMPPFMGLTSWAAFSPARKPGVEAMVMGDMVLFEDEVSSAMSAALDAGLEVTALHNHFFFDHPKVFFMHIGGEGEVATLGRGVRAALDAAKAVRQKSPAPRDHFEGPPIPKKSTIDAAKVEATLGRKGTTKDGMVKVVVGRSATMADCGCKLGKAMGINTWAAFAGSDDNALVDGDFAVTEKELQPVLKALRKGNIHVVAIHHHMTGEEPRILFLHYWGRGPITQLGETLKGALSLTAVDP